MDFSQILTVVEQILSYFKEGDAAAVVGMFKDFDFSAIFDAIKSIITAITSLLG